VLSAEDVERVRFGATKFREGYDQDEVDDMLDRIVATLRHDPSRRVVTADEVYTTTFSSTRFREGYDPDEVDDFLDKVIETLEEVERGQAPKAPGARHEPARHEPERREPVRHEPVRHEPVRHEPSRPEPVRHEPVRHEVSRPEPRREPARHEPSRPEPRREPARRDVARHDPRPVTTTTYHAGLAVPRPSAVDTQQNTLIRPPVDEQSWEDEWDDDDQSWEDTARRPSAPTPPPAPPARGRQQPRQAPSTAHGYPAQQQQYSDPSLPAMPAAAIATRLQLARATLPTEIRDTLVVELPNGSLHPVIDVQTGREGIVLVLG